jgi:hypothetical protein
VNRLEALPLTRLVDSCWIAHEPISFRELCERAVPLDTRLLVLDLDRTLHLGRNMGELLGWEISAYRGYGAGYLDELEPRRHPGRMYLERSRPLRALRYLWKAFWVWVPPGLFYLLWCKIAARIDMLRRRSYVRFGPEPVQAVQRVPQYALFREMASLPDALVRDLARRVWARHRQDLVVEREDLDWLRRRCPGIRIALSSASPREVVETASSALGIEDVIGSSLHCINGGRAKLEALRARFPDLLGVPGVTTVGISDTGYGEDHCWTEAFTHVVDVNSSTGFPPIVSASSPLRAIFSAQILTRAEKDARARGEAWLDPRRGRPAARGAREFRAPELEALLAPARTAIERLARELEARQQRSSSVLDRARLECAALDRTLETAWSAVGTPRGPSRDLRGILAKRLSAQLELARSARPVSEVAFAMTRALERSRELLDRGVAA